MNRRNFLKILSAVPAVATVPALAKIDKDKVISQLEDVIKLQPNKKPYFYSPTQAIDYYIRETGFNDLTYGEPMRRFDIKVKGGDYFTTVLRKSDLSQKEARKIAANHLKKELEHFNIKVSDLEKLTELKL